MTDSVAKRVFVYEVKLCQDNGQKGSGWSVIVVRETTEPTDLLRVARIAAESPIGADSIEKWTGLDEAKLLHVGNLDPRIAA